MLDPSSIVPVMRCALAASVAMTRPFNWMKMSSWNPPAASDRGAAVGTERAGCRAGHARTGVARDGNQRRGMGWFVNDTENQSHVGDWSKSSRLVIAATGHDRDARPRRVQCRARLM